MEKLITFLFCLYFSLSSLGQEKRIDSIPDLIKNTQIHNFRIPDSISDKSFEELKKSFDKNISDSVNASIYAYSFLTKAKGLNDTAKIGSGYQYLAYISSYDIALKYSDTIILWTKDLRTEKYPALGFMVKGYFLKLKSRYAESIDYYLRAYSFAKKADNKVHKIYIQEAVAGMKSMWGSDIEAEKIYEELIREIRQTENYKVQFKHEYYRTLYNLADSYMDNKKYEQSNNLIKEGIELSLTNKDSIDYYSFVSKSGMLEYNKKNYKGALDSLNKGIPYKSSIELAFCYYYKGRVYEDLDDKNSAARNFIRMDSIFEDESFAMPKVRKPYEFLINYYKSSNDFPECLYYIDRLIKLDSIIDHNQLAIYGDITKRYDTPILLEEKEKIITNLKSKAESSQSRIWLLYILVVLIFLFAIYQIRKKHVASKQFQKLLDDTTSKKNKSSDITISNDITNQILDYLNEFEKKKGFRRTDITAVTLAKEFKTNSKYLAKVIQLYKNQSFKNYLNDLRLEYITGELKNNRKFHNYTIKAIANEAGFYSAEAFSKAFYKKNGIYPSYFIKKLKTMINI